MNTHIVFQQKKNRISKNEYTHHISRIKSLFNREIGVVVFAEMIQPKEMDECMARQQHVHYIQTELGKQARMNSRQLGQHLAGLEILKTQLFPF